MSAGSSPRLRKPAFATLSLAVPTVGVLLTLLLMRVPAIGGRGGDFSCYAPAIATCLAALPLGLTGFSLAIASLIRRERWIPLAIFGLALNVFVLSLFVVLVLDL